MTNRIRQMDKEDPAARIVQYWSFCALFVPSWLNRDRIGALRSGGGVLLAWQWFAVEGTYNYDRQGRRKAAPTTPAKARRGRKVNNFPFSGGVTAREL